MKTKKIIADTMPLALKKVRQELGENAIIVNTKSINTGGVLGFFTKQKFEVTAYAVDKEGVRAEPRFSLELKEKPDKTFQKQNSLESNHEDGESHSSGFHKKPQNLYNYYSQSTTSSSLSLEKEKPASSSSQSLEKEKPASSSFQSLEREKPASSSFQSMDKEKSASFASQLSEKDNPLLDELQNMRKMMMTFMLNDKQNNGFPPELSKSVTHLKKQGVDEEVVDHIVNSLIKKHESLLNLDENLIEKEITQIIEEIIQKRIPTSNRVDERTRMINVIGPTGVGKTTSIAKLATEQVLKQKRRVAFITTDVYRIAAVEQLKTYAVILAVPVEVVRTKEELEKALKKLEHYDLIYMDTTGRNYNDEKYRAAINEFINHPIESDNYLTLSLTTKFEDLQILLNEFLDSPIKKLILTKFDETTSYGSILNIAYKYPYQLAYITNGQSVPEDITSIDATMLAKSLLGRN